MIERAVFHHEDNNVFDIGKPHGNMPPDPNLGPAKRRYPPGKALCPPTGRMVWAGTVDCRVISPEPCPRTINAGLLHLLLKSFVIANSLCLSGTNIHTANTLVNTSFSYRIKSWLTSYLFRFLDDARKSPGYRSYKVLCRGQGRLESADLRWQK